MTKDCKVSWAKKTHLAAHISIANILDIGHNTDPNVQKLLEIWRSRDSFIWAIAVQKKKKVKEKEFTFEKSATHVYNILV